MVNTAALLALFIAAQRLAELGVASANRRWILATGGREYGAGHYPLFLCLHSGWLAGWLLEAIWRQELSPVWPLWLSAFVLAQGLRYWCILTLGGFWNTRILVMPGEKRIHRGPYRLLAHPNYLAVSIELCVVPLLFNAWITALTASLLNAVLLLTVRIPAENAALRTASAPSEAKKPFA